MKLPENQLNFELFYSFELENVSPRPVSTETYELKDYDAMLKIEELI